MKSYMICIISYMIFPPFLFPSSVPLSLCPSDESDPLSAAGALHPVSPFSFKVGWQGRQGPGLDRKGQNRTRWDRHQLQRSLKSLSVWFIMFVPGFSGSSWQAVAAKFVFTANSESWLGISF
jgi:hypothetical protein